jgi:hypothetical protein
MRLGSYAGESCGFGPLTSSTPRLLTACSRGRGQFITELPNLTIAVCSSSFFTARSSRSCVHKPSVNASGSHCIVRYSMTCATAAFCFFTRGALRYGRCQLDNSDIIKR